MLEIALAVVLLALAIVPMMGLLQNETRQTALNRNRIFAHHLANNIIERLRMEPLDSLKSKLTDRNSSQAFLSSIDLLNPPPPDTGYAALMKKFRRFAWLDVGSGSDGGKVALTVEVEWDERKHLRKVKTNIVLVDDAAVGRYQ